MLYYGYFFWVVTLEKRAGCRQLKSKPTLVTISSYIAK